MEELRIDMRKPEEANAVVGPAYLGDGRQTRQQHVFQDKPYYALYRRI
jgi:hypothetical protein